MDMTDILICVTALTVLMTTIIVICNLKKDKKKNNDYTDDTYIDHRGV